MTSEEVRACCIKFSYAQFKTDVKLEKPVCRQKKEDKNVESNMKNLELKWSCRPQDFKQSVKACGKTYKNNPR